MGIAIIILVFVGVLFFLITCHELGHFLACRRAGIKVEEFGIGFPPRLLAVKRGETEYSINLIPVGAFVRPLGENDPAVPGGLAGSGPWTRMGVYFSGPLVNVILAFLFLSAYFMVPTKVLSGNGAMIHYVTEDSPAAQAGIRSGDIILRVGDREVHKWEDLQSAVNRDGGSEKTLIIDRNGEELEVRLQPDFDTDSDRYVIGVLLCWGIVANVEEGSPAEQAGVRPGDTILGINGRSVYDEQSMIDAIDSAENGSQLDIVLLRVDDPDIGSEDVIELTVEARAPLGIENRWVEDTVLASERLPVWESFYRGGDFLIHIPSLIKESIPMIRDNPDLAVVGPIGAGQLTVETVNSGGYANVLFMGGLISMGLALFNFLPIPPLDGGGMSIALIEGIRRGKRISERTAHFVYAVGTALMITLFVVIFYLDIARLIRGEDFL
jgi:regulator of sigma E protease